MGTSIIYQTKAYAKDLSFLIEGVDFVLNLLLYQFNVDINSYGPYGFFQDEKSELFLFELLNNCFFYNYRDNCFGKLVLDKNVGKNDLNDKFFLYNIEATLGNEIDLLISKKGSIKYSDKLCLLQIQINSAFFCEKNKFSSAGLNQLHDNENNFIFFKHVSVFNYIAIFRSFDFSIPKQCKRIAEIQGILFKENLDLSLIKPW